MICIILVKKKSGISNKRYGIKFQDPEYSNQMKLVEKKLNNLFMTQLEAAANKQFCKSWADELN
jgi:hypothetical protein